MEEVGFDFAFMFAYSEREDVRVEEDPRHDPRGDQEAPPPRADRPSAQHRRGGRGAGRQTRWPQKDLADVTMGTGTGSLVTSTSMLFVPDAETKAGDIVRVQVHTATANSLTGTRLPEPEGAPVGKTPPIDGRLHGHMDRLSGARNRCSPGGRYAHAVSERKIRSRYERASNTERSRGGRRPHPRRRARRGELSEQHHDAPIAALARLLNAPDRRFLLSWTAPQATCASSRATTSRWSGPRRQVSPSTHLV